MTSRDQLVGVWRLQSYLMKPIDGSAPSYPMGDKPTGILIYTANGYFSVQMMTPGRSKLKGNDWRNGTDVEIREAAEGYVAFSGTYKLDEGKSLVSQTMFVTLIPNWDGETQQREIKIDGDALSTSMVAPVIFGGKKSLAQLVWKRAD